MELKTLKDLKFVNNPSPICKTIKSELRQEAIKWIKDYEMNKAWGGGYWQYSKVIIEFIENFFNITKEDLKK